jgi:pimeloyl-ACP methyl ester carboxylesterase
MDPAYIERRVKRGAPVPPALWPALEKLQCPTLVLWGTESDVLSKAQARRMALTLAKGKLVAVPGVRHASILTEPAALSVIEKVLGL